MDICFAQFLAADELLNQILCVLGGTKKAYDHRYLLFLTRMHCAFLLLQLQVRVI